MTESVSRLASALADRYRIERELGQGGDVARRRGPDGGRTR
jgi:hypothetical protein